MFVCVYGSEEQEGKFGASVCNGNLWMTVVIGVVVKKDRVSGASKCSNTHKISALQKKKSTRILFGYTLQNFSLPFFFNKLAMLEYNFHKILFVANAVSKYMYDIS